MDFEEIATIIKHPNVLDVMKKISTQMYQHWNIKEFSPRVFLSAFMVISNIDDMTESASVSKVDLLTSARELLDSFSNIFNSIISVNTIPVDKFYKDYDKFNELFTLWRDYDLDLIIESLCLAHYELKELEKGLDNKPEEEARIAREGFNRQKNEIRDSVKKLAGDKGIERLDTYQMTLPSVAINTVNF